MDSAIISKIGSDVPADNRESFDRAIKAYREFSNTSVPYGKSSIDYLAETIRAHFIDAQVYDLHQADIELILHDVVVRAHKISGQAEMTRFATTDVPYDKGSIDFIADTIRQHAALAFMDDGFKRALERSLDDAKRRAHLISSAKEMERFAKTDVPYSASSIEHIAKKIIDHARDGGMGDADIAHLNTQVEKAKIRAHEISGRRAIGDLKTGKQHSVEYVDLLARQAREHFKAAGIKVKPEGAPALGFMPAARLGQEIDEAAAAARLRVLRNP